MGWNNNGQLGTGNNDNSNTPVSVLSSGVRNGKSISKVVTGGYYAYALASDGSLFAWGSNEHGQLGTGNRIATNSPAAIITSGFLNGKTVTSIGCGYEHSLALDTYGNVYSWGDNIYSELGNGEGGPGQYSTTPVQVLSLVLPVEIASFCHRLVDGLIHLEWITATEKSNFGFDIERKQLDMPSSGWERLGFVKGNGNSNSPKYYSFSDNFSTSGNLAYRLKQIDSDGSFSYSNTIIVQTRFNSYAFELGQNYPNPFNPSTKFNYTLAEAGEVKITLHNLLGQTIRDILNETQSAGIYTQSLDLTNLPSGVYYYKIATRNYNSTKKLTLLK